MLKFLKMDLRTKLILFAILFGGGYFLYYKKLPPFTPENLKKISDLLGSKRFGKEKDEDEDEDEDKLGPGNLYTVPTTKKSEPQVQLNTKTLQPPQVKADPKIRELFAKNIYKQIFLPYSQYPFLYDKNYIGQTTNASTEPGGINYEGVFMNYRAPIQIGAYQTPGATSSLWNELYNVYGYYPPGGSYNTLYDDSYIDYYELMNPNDYDVDWSKSMSFLASLNAENHAASHRAATIADEIDKENEFKLAREKYYASDQARWDSYDRAGIKIGRLMRRNGNRLSIQA